MAIIIIVIVPFTEPTQSIYLTFPLRYNYEITLYNYGRVIAAAFYNLYPKSTTK